MFWPLNLPMVITFCFLGAISGIFVYVAPRLRMSRQNAFLWSWLICGVAFIPSCMGIMIYVVDPLRFGIFKYQDFNAVHSLHVRRYLPKGAKDITARTRPVGFEAKFKISAKELDDWKTAIWNSDGADADRTNFEDTDEIDAESMLQVFGDPPLKPTESWIVFHGPRARNGGGATIYFCGFRGIAYEDVGYW